MNVTLELIRRVTDETITEIFSLSETDFETEAINWADFGALVEDRPKYIVRFSEGESPKAVALMIKRLKEAGIDPDEVEVICEW
jgi:hypothetical protein